MLARLLPVFIATLLANSSGFGQLRPSLLAAKENTPPPLTRKAASGPVGTLWLEAYNQDGSAVSAADFSNITNYSASPQWFLGLDYGVFPMGTPPAVAQSGSDPGSASQDGTQYVSFTIPANQAVYFTCLWKAPNIGTVFMRADNQGLGYTLAPNETRVLQIPYEFALSEYTVAAQIASNAAVSAQSQAMLAQANALLQTATNAPDNITRAVASYQALGAIMPLKEQMIVEISNASIARSGYRHDFVLNYEGFGSWQASANLANYTSARAAGFTYLLTVPDWNQISPAQGVYNFASFDAQVNSALALGYDLSVCGVNQAIGSMPAWVQNLSLDDMKKVFYQNAFMFVQRYQGKIKSIYPQSEPELAVQGHTVADVGELTRQSFAGARAAAPGMQFGIYASASAYVGYQLNPPPGPNPDVLSGWDVLNYMSQNGITPDYIGVEMQYATIFAPVDLQRQQELLQTYYNVFKVPLYIGETGYSSKTEDYGLQNPFYWHDGLTEQAQAQWADGLLRIAYGTPYVKGLNWVQLDPDYLASYSSTPEFTAISGTSLFRSDGVQKKAYGVFKNFTTQIPAYTPGVPGSPNSIVIAGGANQTTAVNTLYASPLQAKVEDFLGNGIPGLSVTFTAPVSGASGTFAGVASATAVTDASGIATAPAFTANASTGAFHVTAAVTVLSTPVLFSLTNAAAVTIDSVQMANGGADISQNAWIVIKGKNLTPPNTPPAGMDWSSAPEFQSGQMPIKLASFPLTVTVNSKPAFLYYFCSSATSSQCPSDQINVLTPLDNTLGPVQIVVTNGGLSSAPFSVNIRAASPALPLVGATQYVVATHADNSLIGPPSLSAPGYAFTPASRGETIVLYGFGFGLPSTTLVSGAASQSGALPESPVVQIGGVTAQIIFAGVISPGLYQLNVTVPMAVAPGDNSVTCSYMGVTIPPGDLITIQ